MTAMKRDNSLLEIYTKSECNLKKFDGSMWNNGDKFYIMGVQERSHSEYGVNRVWTAFRDKPKNDMAEGCLKAQDSYTFYEGAGTKWLNDLPDRKKNMMNDKKYAIEIIFLGMSGKSIRMKPSGFYIEWNPVEAFRQANNKKKLTTSMAAATTAPTPVKKAKKIQEIEPEEEEEEEEEAEEETVEGEVSE
jgi:hypothetical protein